MVSIDNSVQSIALGSFDGMHVAHRKLISLVDAVAVIERDAPCRLTPGYKRSWYCDRPLAFYLFERIRHLGAGEFVKKLQEDYPRLERIVVGYDFRFGKDREGTPEMLERFFAGKVQVVSEVKVDGISVHSRTIRMALERGELKKAERMLGRPYAVDGEPVRGQGLGSREFVPTINLAVEGYQLPAEGVYAGVTNVEGERRPSVIFLGHRKTTDGSFAVETHLLDRAPEKVPARILLEFHAFLRPNRHFESFQALRVQIRKDIEEAATYLGT